MEEVLKPFQVEKGWRQAAVAQIFKLQKVRFKGSVSEEKVRKVIGAYSRGRFRRMMFRAIGHQYVVNLQHVLTINKKNGKLKEVATDKLTTVPTLTKREWAKKLGVSPTTPWRWQTDKALALADKFFAAHLLFLDMEIGEITLPTNEYLLLHSEYSAIRFLQRKMRTSKDKSKLTESAHSLVADLVHIMSMPNAPVYNPYVQDASSQNEALIRLTNQLIQYSARYRRLPGAPSDADSSSHTPPLFASQIKSLIDKWCLPFIVFRLLYYPSWKQYNHRQFQ